MLQCMRAIYRKSTYSLKVLPIAVKYNQSALNFISQKLIWPAAAIQSKTLKHQKTPIFFFHILDTLSHN